MRAAFLQLTPLTASNGFISRSTSRLRNPVAITPHHNPFRLRVTSATAPTLRLQASSRTISTESLRTADVSVSDNPHRQSAVPADPSIHQAFPASTDLPPSENAKPHSPAISEDSRFPSTQAIRFWRKYRPQPEPFANLGDHFRFIARAITRDASSIPYWFFTMPRLAYFGGMSSILLVGAQGPRVLRGSSDAATVLMHYLDEALYTVRADFENVRDGVYRLPWDMRLNHRQHNPLFVLRQTALYVREGFSIASKFGDEKRDVSVWMESSLLPDYYKQTYHLQTDGWLSSASAEVYETSTESLFFGRQDAMQRLTLIAISEYVGKCNIPQRKLNMVEIGAGTGRVATFVRDNWPEANYTITDLSAFYLEKARHNMEYWERKSADRVSTLGRVRFKQAAAEEMPIGAQSADIVYCVYLFHELPPQVRRRVLREVQRVLKVGGLFVLTDSIQRGDQLAVDEVLGSFSSLNEPWYESYIEEDFAELLCASGEFTPLKKEVRSKSKMVSFIKTK